MSYFKGKPVCLDESMKEQLSELKERVDELEFEKGELEEKIELFLNEEICGMKGGVYKPEIRRVYAEIMSMGVGAKNVERIVRCVLNKIAGVNVDRLPKETCAQRILYECRGMAWVQLSEVLMNENLTLHSDGTTKLHHHYGTYDVATGEKDVYVVGMREMSGGDASTVLDVLKEIVNDVCKIGESDDVSEKVKKAVVNVKNTMSDRHAVQKKFNELLYEYRMSVLPDVIEGLDEMNESERESMVRMNNFFCGMHYMVGLSEQADKCLKVWENLVFGEDDVGACAALPLKRQNESGTVRMIRTVCKAVQERGCEKSGKPEEFRVFVKERTGMKEIPLAPFKGNRFNIAFHNGAGVYVLSDVLIEFLEGVKEENMLMKAVCADVKVLQYVAGARALGLIGKLVTVPLWKVLEKKGHVSEMNVRYERMLECFERWALDASCLLKGSESVFDDVVVEKDGVFEKLVEENGVLDGMTLQVLQILCASFACKTKMLVSDHLNGGRHATLNGGEEVLMNETVSVKRTNVDSERDFGMLDVLMRLRPRAWCIVHESLVMLKRNKMLEWLDGLDEKRMKEVMEVGRKSVEVQRKEYLERMGEIERKKSEKVDEKFREKQRKEVNAQIRKEKVSADLNEVGGLWMNEDDLEVNVSGMNEKEKRGAIEAQLKFRKVVLNEKSESGLLNVTSRGRKLSVSELESNLRKVLCESEVRHEVERSERVVNIDERIPSDEVLNEKVNEYLSSEVESGAPVCKRRKLEVLSGTPVVRKSDDMTGKRVKVMIENAWQKGVVYSENEGCVVKCENGNVHILGDVMKELKEGRLFLLKLGVNDLIGCRIQQRFDMSDGSSEWWSASVVGMSQESERENPMFVIVYDRCEEGDEDGDEENVFEYCLYEDYVNGDLRLIR